MEALGFETRNVYHLLIGRLQTDTSASTTNIEFDAHILLRGAVSLIGKQRKSCRDVSASFIVGKNVVHKFHAGPTIWTVAGSSICVTKALQHFHHWDGGLIHDECGVPTQQQS